MSSSSDPLPHMLRVDVVDIESWSTSVGRRDLPFPGIVASLALAQTLYSQWRVCHGRILGNLEETQNEEEQQSIHVLKGREV